MLRGGRKTLANLNPETAHSIQSNLPARKDLTCLARDVLNIAANNITRQIS